MTFESQYYESSEFWNAGMVEDEGNLKRLRRTARLLPRDARNLLDAGCGNGVFARVVKQEFPHVRITCIDRSATALDHVIADEKLRCEIVSLPFADQSFDCVSCLEVIEHLTVEDYDRALSELTRVARTSLIIGVPYNEAIEKNVDTCPQCRTVFNRDLHLRSFDDATLANLLTKFGFCMEHRYIPVENINYLGFRTYYRLRRWLKGEAGSSKQFQSPICPVCGYVPATDAHEERRVERVERVEDVATPRRGFDRGIRAVLKRCWPTRRTPGYWIVGCFRRSQAAQPSVLQKTRNACE